MIDEIDKRVRLLRRASTFEEHAHEAHLSIWNRKDELFQGVGPSNPLDLVDPAVGLFVKGFEVKSDPALGEMWEDGIHSRVAGIVDQRSGIVRVAVGLSEEERRFTTGHELGHVIMHPNMTGLHRDRVVAGPMVRKNAREREADAFCSCFIMPAKMVMKRFLQCFRMATFYLNEDSVFGLGLGTIDRAQRTIRTKRQASLAVATAGGFMGVAFEPMSRFFRVSPTAMAIRLEEVGLVDERSIRRNW